MENSRISISVSPSTNPSITAAHEIGDVTIWQAVAQWFVHPVARELSVSGAAVHRPRGSISEGIGPRSVTSHGDETH